MFSNRSVFSLIACGFVAVVLMCGCEDPLPPYVAPVADIRVGITPDMPPSYVLRMRQGYDEITFVNNSGGALNIGVHNNYEETLQGTAAVDGRITIYSFAAGGYRLEAPVKLEHLMASPYYDRTSNIITLLSGGALWVRYPWSPSENFRAFLANMPYTVIRENDTGFVMRYEEILFKAFARVRIFKELGVLDTDTSEFNVRFEVNVSKYWNPIAALNVPRERAAGARVNFDPVVVGGINNGAPSNVVEVFNQSAGTWSSLPPMPTARFDCGAAWTGGRLFVVGGRDSIGALSTVEAYDPSSGAWSQRAPMPSARSRFGISAYGGKIYVAGGEGSPTSFEVYDPAANSWSVLPSLAMPRVDASVGGTEGIIVIAGGRAGSGGLPLPTAERFDAVAGIWLSSVELHYGVSGRNSVSAFGEIVMMDGETEYGLMTRVTAFSINSSQLSERSRLPRAFINPSVSFSGVYIFVVDAQGGYRYDALGDR